MSWLTLIDRTRALFRPDGLARFGHPLRADPFPSTRPLPTGSLLLETRVSPQDRPQVLLGYRPTDTAGTVVSLQAVPGGGVVLVMTRGGETFHVAANLDTGGRTDVLRMTYSWDIRVGRGRLAIERPGTTCIEIRDLDAPMALTKSDIREMTVAASTRVLSPDVCFLAVSDRVEPVGPMPSLSPATPVMTARGYRPVGELKRGDVVQTLDGGGVPVLATFRRTVPAAGLFAPVRLRAPFFGLSRDVTVAPAQRLVIGGSRVEYMFGSEQVLVPSGHLLHGNAAQLRKGDLLITYCQLLLPDHEAILCAGTYVETMNIGRIRRRPALLRASLAGQVPRADLPEHSMTAYPVLGEFEALTLAAQRAA